MGKKLGHLKNGKIASAEIETIEDDHDCGLAGGGDDQHHTHHPGMKGHPHFDQPFSHGHNEHTNPGLGNGHESHGNGWGLGHGYADCPPPPCPDGDPTGQVQINGTTGDDVIEAEPTVESTIAGNEGNDIIIGGDYDDFLLGNSHDDDLYGGCGDDTLHGGRDSDLLYGGAGNDLLAGNLGSDHLWGDAGADTFWFRPLFIADDTFDVIEDFDVLEDNVLLDRFPDDVLVETLQNGADAEFYIDGDLEAVFLNVDATELASLITIA